MTRHLCDRIRSAVSYPVPAPFFRNDFHIDLDGGYILTDYIERGQMLSETFETHKEDKDLQSNLYADLSRILLSLGRIPQPRIGSYTFDDKGMVTLSNRPLTCLLHILENERVPTSIDRKTTYSSVGGYVHDLLGYHDNRLLYQPNSINDEADGRRQMAAISLMRTTAPQFINPQTCNGPFVFTLTDLHQSNIFVDQDWHITSLIDLEWACSLPVEMQQPPYWITGDTLDHLTGEKLENFVQARNKFMSIFECEEKMSMDASQAPRTRTMQRNWETGSFWFFSALDTTKALYNIFYRNIYPNFSASFPYQEVSHYWRMDTDKIIQAKLKDRQIYCQNLVQKAMRKRDLSRRGSSEQEDAVVGERVGLERELGKPKMNEGIV